LISNAVILLLINDLDEQFYSYLEHLAPNWLQSRFKEVQINLSEEKEADKSREDECSLWNSVEPNIYSHGCLNYFFRTFSKLDSQYNDE